MNFKLVSLITAILILSFYQVDSQIIYNKSKPFSYNSKGLTEIEKLPFLDYQTEKNGNLFKQGLNIDIMGFALIEKVENNFIARARVKVHAEKLGNITLICKNIKLNNNSYCYIFTTDYQIVAGPVSQSSVIDDLVISNLPADELVFEIVFKDYHEAEIILDEIYYITNKEKKEKVSEELTSDTVRNYNCNYGEVQYFEDTQLLNDFKCGEYGYPGTYNTFETKYIRSITDFQFAASRASCVVYVPIFPGDFYYSTRNHIGENGTLINFPYDSCGNEDCGSGFVVGVYHQGFAGAMVNATTNNNQEFLNKILIRFNLHHKFGTPWHLKAKDCKANDENFKKWRETIDFSEVIDYCGASLLLYDTNLNDNINADIFIIKMKQKPFYKELHLGWTTQESFPNTNKYHAIGRHGTGPTMIFYDETAKSRNIQIDNFSMNKSTGISGSCATTNDYLNNNEKISFGLIKRATQNGKGIYLNPRTFNEFFNNFNNVKFYLDTNCQPNFTKIDDYIDQSKFNNIVNHEPNYDWMPSKENRELCPSGQGWNEQTQEYDPCNFGSEFYTSYFDTLDNCLHIILNQLASSNFPNQQMPKGYRIYHKYGDQKTILFKSFNDGLDINTNIDFCISKCDILYLMFLGREQINIGIDFYDEDGRVLNNRGCDSLNINIDFPFSFCDLFNIDNINVEKVYNTEHPDYPNNAHECCKYKFTIDISGCDNEQILSRILDNLYFVNKNDSTNIKQVNGVEINYSQGIISFYREVCSDQPLNYNFVYLSNIIDCINTPKDLPFCYCNCSPYSSNWFELTLTAGGDSTGCSEDQCKVTGTINIPEFFNCPDTAFTHYSISPYHFLKHELTSNNNIPEYQTSSIGCLNKGESRYDVIKLYRGIGDQNPCEISKLIYCPLNDKTKPCTPDCDSAEWKTYRFKEWLPLPGCPDCKVIADYVARKNPCTGMQEIQIVKFETLSFDNNKTACENCNISIDDIYKIVLKKAIYDNQMGFEPILDEQNPEDSLCNETWRVVQGACWISYTDYLFQQEGGKVVYKPCYSVECCSVGLRVCRYSGPPDYISITTLGGTNQSNCIGFTQPVFDPLGLQNPIYNPDGSVSYNTTTILPCQSRCNWLYGLSDSQYNNSDYYGKDAIFELIPDSSKNRNDMLMKLIDKVDYIDCLIYSPINSDNSTITVYNMLGVSMENIKINVKKGINSYKIKTLNYYPGLYILQLTINGTKKLSDKFIIIR